jgi:hypothetical protein
MDNPTTITVYWWGYNGKILTKEEYDAKVAEDENRRYQEWLETHSPDYEPPEYDW